MSTFFNRTPSIYFHNGLLWLMALGEHSEVVWTNWESASQYPQATPQPLFADDTWRSDFPPSLYTVLGQLGLCLCDKQGRVYFTTFDGQHWTPVQDPYTPWDDWSTVNNSTPRPCTLVQIVSGFSTANWMSTLNDNLSLADISIPGTHDSFTYTASTADLSVRCQSAAFQAQLQDGIRFFDLRLSAQGNVNPPEFKLYHGIVNLDLTFSEIYADALAFLAARPSEAVIFCIKDTDDNNNPRLFGNTLAYFVDQNPRAWHTGRDLPTIGQARGKIVLFRRFKNPSDRDWGIDLTTGWDNHSGNDVVNAGPAGMFYIQDDYSWTVFQYRDKYDAVANMMSTTTNKGLGEGFYLNFSSASDGAFPLTFATLINPRVAELVAGISRTAELPVCLGTVAMDFYHESVAALIAQSNFPKA